MSEFRDRVKPSICVCGCRRMNHANSRDACRDCECRKFAKATKGLRVMGNIPGYAQNRNDRIRRNVRRLLG